MTPEQEEKSKRLHYLLNESVEINKWRRKMLYKLMTDIAPRIAKIGQTGYTGCGFHYEKVHQVGRLINELAIGFNPCMNWLEKNEEELPMWIVRRVIAEELIKDVVKVERSLKKKKVK